MSAELRVEVDVGDAGRCPVAAASADADADADVSSVRRASVADEDGEVSEEFTAEGTLSRPRDVERVAERDAGVVYRFRRAYGCGCVCERVEAFGTPVTDLRAADGTLTVSFHAADLDTVRDVIDDLRERFGDVRLRKLVHAGEGGETDPVFVDRSRLTARQREVLLTAHEMGYFEYPREANASDVADSLDITASTFTEHLGAAQRKVLGAVLERQPTDP